MLYTNQSRGNKSMERMVALRAQKKSMKRKYSVNEYPRHTLSGSRLTWILQSGNSHLVFDLISTQRVSLKRYPNQHSLIGDVGVDASKCTSNEFLSPHQQIRVRIVRRYISTTTISAPCGCGLPLFWISSPLSRSNLLGSRPIRCQVKIQVFGYPVSIHC